MPSEAEPPHCRLSLRLPWFAQQAPAQACLAARRRATIRQRGASAACKMFRLCIPLLSASRAKLLRTVSARYSTTIALRTNCVSSGHAGCRKALTPPLLQCAKAAAYCSKACQTTAWKAGHKRVRAGAGRGGLRADPAGAAGSSGERLEEKASGGRLAGHRGAGDRGASTGAGREGGASRNGWGLSGE